ncbi:TMEM175 family protein [Streptococcus sp. zg-JUN1979]|uniref:TMEM175 family protein n=1 Tax=Streptococcus sp. zg-JUN1979 TaxID=3391450 RepID=UPI0039A4D736
MSKERLVAFTDAVLAIIMTILVLELEKPEVISWQGFWALRMNFFAYTISFFWLGTMWVNLHRAWDGVKHITNKLVWISLLLLFFSSLVPYVTTLVSSDFNNSVAQAAYGIIVLLVTFSNVWMYQELATLPDNANQEAIVAHNDKRMALDVAIKILGLVLSLTIWPPAMMWSVLATAGVLILPRALR